MNNPNGQNVTQAFAEEGDEELPKQADVIPCHPYAAVGLMNLNAMLVENIRSHDYFKGLEEHTTFEQVVDQIYYDCKVVSLWQPGTHKVKSASGILVIWRISSSFSIALNPPRQIHRNKL